MITIGHDKYYCPLCKRFFEVPELAIVAGVCNDGEHEITLRTQQEIDQIYLEERWDDAAQDAYGTFRQQRGDHKMNYRLWTRDDPATRKEFAEYLENVAKWVRDRK